MNSKKVFYIMAGVVALMVLMVIGATVFGDKLLQNQSNKLISLKLSNDVIEDRQTSLVQAKKDIKKYTQLKDIAKEIVPQDKDQARVTREIISIANDAGIKIGGVTFPASTLGQVQPKASGDSSKSAAVTQVKPVTGIKGLYQLDITVNSDTNSPTTYGKLIDFLSRLEQNRRTAQVSQISIQPDTKNHSNLSFTLIITVYIKP